MSKLTSELKKKADEKIVAFNMDELVHQANHLLAASSEEDVALLEELGLDHQIRATKERQKISNKIQHLSSKLGDEAYHGADIKGLCNLYDLRILSIDKYNGSIPADLTQKIKEFHDRNDLLINRTNLFILAPVEQFETVEYVKPKPPERVDPVVLYREPRNDGSRMVHEEDVLVKIHEWGSDFTPVRFFRHYFNEHEGEGVSPLLWMGLAVLLIALFVGMYNPTTLLVCSIVAGIFLVAATLLTPYSENWNTNIKG